MKKGELEFLVLKREFKKSTVDLNFETFCNNFFGMLVQKIVSAVKKLKEEISNPFKTEYNILNNNS